MCFYLYSTVITTKSVEWPKVIDFGPWKAEDNQKQTLFPSRESGFLCGWCHIFNMYMRSFMSIFFSCTFSSVVACPLCHFEMIIYVILNLGVLPEELLALCLSSSAIVTSLACTDRGAILGVLFLWIITLWQPPESDSRYKHRVTDLSIVTKNCEFL